MKPKMARKNLLGRSDIRNAVITVLMESNFPSDNAVLNEADFVFQYNCELESGGHESFIRWQSHEILQIGITPYLAKLIEILEKIEAVEYASILKKYGEQMWALYIALENNEISEESYYEVINQADKEYFDLNDKIYDLISIYFVNIHTQLIDIE
ncbi:hypothetical protein ACIQ2D_21245 [Lysinibacillus sp. NPDC097287]|uniref:DMP19 family protein n=1 Tax=Lysinibacillus sp. NPDC097287 TaxID=3364144 RepID=UPI0037F17D4C